MNARTGSAHILVVSNDPLTRAGLAALLSDSDDFVVVGRVPGDTHLVEELDIYSPDAALWDLSWEPSLTREASIEPLRAVAETGLPVVVLLAGDELALAAWSANARGFLMRSSPQEVILAALEAALEGLVVIDPALSPVLLTTPRPIDSTPEEPLTARELEVLRLLAEGHSNRGIAHQLSISEHTVKFHINAIMTKLNAQSRTEAVVRATRLGLISL